MRSAALYLLRTMKTRALTLLLITGLVVGIVPIAGLEAAAVVVSRDRRDIADDDDS